MPITKNSLHVEKYKMYIISQKNTLHKYAGYYENIW